MHNDITSVCEARRVSPALPFARRKEPPPMRLTERDVAIIRHVNENRFATTEQIVRLMDGWGGKGWNKRKTQDRLYKLYHNGYLDLPQCQVQDWKLGRPREYVYGLGNRGADELNIRFGFLRRKVDWKDKNYTFKLYPLKHTLVITELAVSLEADARRRGAIRPIWLDEIAASMPTGARRTQPDRWDIEIERPHAEPKEIRVVPDKIFGIQHVNRSAPNREHFFLEADLRTNRSTARAPTRSLLRKSSPPTVLHFWRGSARLIPGSLLCGRTLSMASAS